MRRGAVVKAVQFGGARSPICYFIRVIIALILLAIKSVLG